MEYPKRIFNRPTGLALIVLYKAVWGLAEIGIGVTLALSQRIITGELAEDPSDVLVNWILAHVKINYAGFTQAGLVIIGLGLVKLVLAGGLWFGSWRFRTVALVFFAAAAALGAYRLSQGFSWTWCLSLMADLLIVAYLWLLLPKHLSKA